MVGAVIAIAIGYSTAKVANQVGTIKILAPHWQMDLKKYWLCQTFHKNQKKARLRIAFFWFLWMD